MVADRVTRWAAAARRIFDRISERVGSVTVVAVLAAATAYIAGRQTALLESGDACTQLPVAIIRLEVTFSASRFFALFHSEGACAPNIESSFVTWDAVFPLAYGAFLSALYLWAERWRRFGSDDAACPFAASLRRDALVVAPFVAAALDITVENLDLWYAGRHLGEPHGMASPFVAAAVMFGSLGALLKWLLLLLSAGGIVAELLSGPRGAILWRLRFSVLAVALGAVPLLAIPQGQDILQRIFETEHPGWRLFAAVPPLILAAFGVWYFGRKLAELRLDGRPVPVVHGWYEFFAENIPRLLGIASLVLPGVAFANAGEAGLWYVVVAAGTFLVALLIGRVLPAAFAGVGRLLMPYKRRDVPSLAMRLGMCVFASIVGVLSAFPRFEWAPLLPTRYLRLAAYLCFVAAWFFQLFVAFRRAARNARLAHLGVAEPAHPPINSVDPCELGRGLKVGAAATGLLSLLCLIAFTVKPVPIGRALGPLWILSLAAVNAVFVGSITVWVGRRFRIPVVIVSLVLALLFSLWNDGHTVRTLDAKTIQDTTTGQSIPVPTAIAARPTIDEQFSAWLNTYHRDDLPKDVPVVLVAGAGGGLRAAYWTAMALAAIADAVPSFEEHLFAFSGVSGGSLGRLFTALVRDRHTKGALDCHVPSTEPAPRPATSGVYARCVHDFMRDDFLSPVLAKLVAPDFLQLFLPFPYDKLDRSWGLEQSWEDSYLRATGHHTFSEGFLAFTRSPRPSAPALILNSTHVETGRRYMASSVYRRKGADISPALEDAGDILDTLKKDLPLSTSVHNSARFTYVSPAGHIDNGDGFEYGRLVDGGYFENSGLATLREVYDILDKRGVTPYVLYLCNDPRACDIPLASTDVMTVPSAAADELASPIRALLKTRDARGSLAQGTLRTLAGDRFLQMNVCRDLPTTKLATTAASATEKEEKKKKTQDRVVSPPLGWLLSSLARDWMDASLEGTPGGVGCYGQNATAIDTLRTALVAK